MIKFTKKKLAVVFPVVFLLLFFFTTSNSFASSCSNYGGSTTYCDDGTSYSNYGGSTTYGSDGSSYSNYGGSTTYGSDGSTQSNYGGSTTYDSDGTSYSNYGGSTTYGSDGSTYDNYGGSTTYGSGGGKMIETGGNDDSNQSDYSGSVIFESDRSKTIGTNEESSLSSDRWNDIENMLTPTADSEQLNDQQSDNEQINSYDSIPSLDNNSSNTQVNQNISETNLKTQNKERVFVWWNPSTWWDYFFNKSASLANSNGAEPIKSIEHKTLPSSFEWKEYSSDTGKFTALFPYAVTHGNWMDNTTMKKLGWNNISKIETFDAKTNNDEHFSVWFHQYVNQNNSTNKTTLKTSLYNLLNLMKDYKLTFADYSKHGKYDALDYLIFNERENKYEKGKFIAVKQNVYQIFMDYKGENFNDVDINKFFASFYPQ